MSGDVVVQLTADEVHLAAIHGVLRRYNKLAGRRTDRIQRNPSSWDNEIEGACAELAFCKHRGWHWSGAEQLRSKDGGRFDVRWTRHEGKGGLIVYPHDDDATIVVLMDGRAPSYRCVGWLRAAEAKQPDWLTDFGYLVPREALHGKAVAAAPLPISRPRVEDFPIADDRARPPW